MDIVEFLKDDHRRLEREMISIRQELSHEDLREKIKAFTADYGAHEAIEEEFLYPALQGALPKTPKLTTMVPGYEEVHGNIWKLLGRLLDCLNYGHFCDLQQAFFDFHAFAEVHMEREERILFPLAKEVVDAKTLEELGQKAAERYAAKPRAKEAVKTALGLA